LRNFLELCEWNADGANLVGAMVCDALFSGQKTFPATGSDKEKERALRNAWNQAERKWINSASRFESSDCRDPDRLAVNWLCQQYRDRKDFPFLTSHICEGKYCLLEEYAAKLAA
jgi:hypothetical protein